MAIAFTALAEVLVNGFDPSFLKQRQRAGEMPLVK
jgi:hypothetical protein